jgi:hypothetical protein
MSLDAPPLVGQGRRPTRKGPWPKLPWWVWTAVAVSVVAFLVVAGIALSWVLSVKEQPLYERRTPSADGQSHHVGRVEVSPREPVAARCGDIRGLRLAGDVNELPLLQEALEKGVCEDFVKSTADGAELARRMERAAGKGAIVSFGVFERTGEDTATLAPATGPPRILINGRYLDGVFKGFLAPLLAHELWHAGSATVSAADELAARRIEAEVCDKIPTANKTSRSCQDAQRIAADSGALTSLRAAGFG